MEGIDLTIALKKYTSGWVAIDKKNKVVAHAESFEEIEKKVKNIKDVVVISVSKDYFGIVTFIHE